MEIKTEFLGKYTNKIDKLISHSNNQTHNIWSYNSYIAVNFGRWVKAITGEPLDIRSKLNYS